MNASMAADPNPMAGWKLAGSFTSLPPGNSAASGGQAAHGALAVRVALRPGIAWSEPLPPRAAQIHKTVARVRALGAAQVALQFPEGLLMYACAIADILEQ